MKDSGVGVVGVGQYIPALKVTNQELETLTHIPEAEILKKTGIKTRYYVDDTETASGISAQAALAAIKMANIKAEEIDLIIFCGFSGDYIYPATACKIQELIGAKNAGGFDLMANCTGFQVGLTIASDWMKSDVTLSYCLVVGTAIQSRFFKKNDPNAAIYFGDGAGAAILGRVPQGYGVLATDIFTNSTVFESVRLRGGGSSFPLTPENIHLGLQYYEMNGLEVWKQVIQYQPKVVKRALDKLNLTVRDVDFFLFHQANLRLIEYLMGKMKLPMTKTCTNVQDIGNTADASLAIVLCDAVNQKRLKTDDIVVISGVGAGFIFGATVLRWY